MTTQTKNIPEHQPAPFDANNIAYKTSNGQTTLVEDSQKHLKTVARRAYSGQKRSALGRPEDEQIAQFLPMVHKIVQRVVTY
ncbi:MAG: hypothetical protein ACYTEO_01085, partial [Planctomycetota bacterium]